MSSHSEIQVTVTEIMDLLATHGDVYVVDRLRSYRDRLEQQDASVIATLLSEATGSMGSLRDRYLSASNGDCITDADRERVNAQLLALVTLLAEQIRAVRSADSDA